LYEAALEKDAAGRSTFLAQAPQVHLLVDSMTAMGWQKHTTRAMLSAGGSLTKKHGLAIASEKIGHKRTYSIKA
jgi:hypothetical protein